MYVYVWSKDASMYTCVKCTQVWMCLCYCIIIFVYTYIIMYGYMCIYAGVYVNMYVQMYVFNYVCVCVLVYMYCFQYVYECVKYTHMLEYCFVRVYISRYCNAWILISVTDQRAVGPTGRRIKGRTKSFLSD